MYCFFFALNFAQRYKKKLTYANFGRTKWQKMDILAEKEAVAQVLPVIGCKRKVRESNAHYATNCLTKLGGKNYETCNVS